MIVAGVDPSLTSAGIAILTDGKPTLLTSIGHKGHNAASYEQRGRRISSQCHAIMNAICARQWTAQPDLAVIEGPAYSQNLPSASDRHGLFWGLICALSRRKIPLAVVTPTARCAFATGKGRAEKRTVLAEGRAAFGLRVTNHDIADAAFLAAMGALHLGDQPFTPRRRHIEGLTKITWPETSRA